MAATLNRQVEHDLGSSSRGEGPRVGAERRGGEVSWDEEVVPTLRKSEFRSISSRRDAVAEGGYSRRLGVERRRSEGGDGTNEGFAQAVFRVLETLLSP